MFPKLGSFGIVNGLLDLHPKTFIISKTKFVVRLHNIVKSYYEMKLTFVGGMVGRRKASTELLEPFPSSAYESLLLLSSVQWFDINMV